MTKCVECKIAWVLGVWVGPGGMLRNLTELLLAGRQSPKIREFGAVPLHRCPCASDHVPWLPILAHVLAVLAHLSTLSGLPVRFPFADARRFGSRFLDGTNGQFGVLEMLMSTAISGVLFSTFAGQPVAHHPAAQYLKRHAQASHCPSSGQLDPSWPTRWWFTTLPSGRTSSSC